MTGKLSYDGLERSINELEREVLENVRKEKKFNKERKLLEYRHIKRTISLMKINEDGIGDKVGDKGKRDKDKLEQHKKGKQTVKEKRKQKKDKKKSIWANGR